MSGAKSRIILALMVLGFPGALAAQDAADRADGAQALEVVAASPKVAPDTAQSDDAATPTAKLDASAEGGAPLELKPPKIATAAFAGRSPVSSAKVSPDGQHIAAVITKDKIPNIVLYNGSTRKALGKVPAGEGTEIEWFRWAGSDKILLSLSSMGRFRGEEARFTRLAILNIKEGWVENLGGKTGVLRGDDVIHVAKDGSYALVSVQKDVYSYPSVFRYELTRDGKTKEIQLPLVGVWSWHADNAGVVRAGVGWRSKRLRVYYRTGPGKKLKLVAKIKEDDEKSKYWDVAQIVEGSDQGYVLEENDEGRVGLHLFDYAKREIIETIYENPDWDLDYVTFRDGKPLAAFYTDEQRQVIWFDDEYKKQYDRLDKALQEENIWVTSRSRDHSRMLVWAGGPADPGALYVYSPTEKRIDLFTDMRPKINFQQLVAPKPVKYTARDGTEIHGYLTLPKGREAKDLPLILLPHGGPYGVRDSLRYNDEVQLLANRGYAVLQPNYRGSDGYGEEFFELGAGQIGRKMQDDIDDAMDWAVKQGIADPNRVCVVGASYGGYAALWSVIRNPERYRCAASWAGVTDWDIMLKYDRRYFSRKAGKKWEARVQGQEDFDLDTVSPYRLAETLKRPVLLAHGKDDNNVPFAQFRKFRNAAKKAPVKPVELVIDDEGHSFSKPENEQAWYDALEAFLAEHNPAD